MNKKPLDRHDYISENFLVFLPLYNFKQFHVRFLLNQALRFEDLKI